VIIRVLRPHTWVPESHPKGLAFGCRVISGTTEDEGSLCNKLGCRTEYLRIETQLGGACVELEWPGLRLSGIVQFFKEAHAEGHRREDVLSRRIAARIVIDTFFNAKHGLTLHPAKGSPMNPAKSP